MVPEIADIDRVPLPGEVEAVVAEASAEIARFDAEVGADVAPSSAILLRSESAESSKIENLTASAKAIALAELGDPSRRNAAVIVANTHAMQAAIALADHLDENAVLQMHSALLGSTRPEWCGDWRDQQVWIGGSNAAPFGAHYVVPHHEHIPALMADLARFVDRDDLPALTQALRASQATVGDRMRPVTVDGTGPAWLNPQAAPTGTMPGLPETRNYKLKRFLLGPPLISENLHTERLSKPVALAVLSSDVMSSSAYATESMLRILLPAAGVGAFVLVTPITGLILLVLAVVCLCYRQVVQAYPVSGGSYVVSRENFGYNVAQIPGAALLCSYTLTVAVSIAAGVDAIISAFPALSPYPIEMSIGFVVIITYGNLRGVREAGRVFAIPTYWFIANMALLVGVGVFRLALHGKLAHIAGGPGQVHSGVAGGGLLYGAAIFIVLRGFANGGSAMTGMEAISNAVTVFKEPQVRNARITLVLMASILGTMFLGVSALAALTHAPVFSSGTPTVLSEIGKAVFGSSPVGHVLYFSLQFSTALILVLGANTSYNGFPLLVSFIAEDAFLPRPLTTRGHRLVFSNGILVLTVMSLLLLVGSGAKVANLIPLYACTVFTGFTMAGAGMVRYHLRHPGPKRSSRLTVAGGAFVCSAVVTLIFVVTEFTRGAWLVVVVIPVLVATLAWTHRRYQAEKRVLAEDAAAAATEEPALPNHVVVVLVDRIDLATARALQLARSLASGGELRAVHFSLDDEKSARLTRAWTRLGLGAFPLDVIECADRRLVRGAVELAADLASGGRTEVLMVLPRRAYKGWINRVLHDNTADRIVAGVSEIPHVSAIAAPFDVGGLVRQRTRGRRIDDETQQAVQMVANGSVPGPSAAPADPADPGAAGSVLGGARFRQRVTLTGRVRTVRVQPWAGVPTFECTLVGPSGTMNVVFLGRRSVAGISPGTRLQVEGVVGSHHGTLAMLNPVYEILSAEATGTAETA